MTATAAPTESTVITARALLLDMDGTLVNSDAVVERIWRRWAERHGLDGDEVMKVVHGRQGYASMALLLPDRPMEQNHADNARMLAEETADVDGVVPIPGAPEFLASLRGLPHALVTSADVALSTARMAAAGLELPDVRVTAESVGASKPDPEGFLKGPPSWGSRRRTVWCSRTPGPASRRGAPRGCGSWGSVLGPGSTGLMCW